MTIIQDLGEYRSNHLFIKREDLIPFSFGGNKARKAHLFFQEIEKGDYDRATEDYNKAIKLSPQLAETYYNKGVLYRRQGDYDQAIENYTKATETNPHLAPAYINRGFAYMKRGKDGDYVLAKADFEKGLTLNPDEEIRQKLQENLHKLEDWMKEKADKASAQQP